MSVDRENRLDRLLTLARQAGIEASPLEEGFESRLLARIREDRERKAAWFSWTWRLAPVFFLIVVFLGALEYAAPSISPPGLYTVVAGVVDGEQFAYLWTEE